MGEVFLDKRRGGHARLLGRQRVQAHPARDVRPKMGRVPGRIAQGNRIEVDKDDAVARQENMIGLEVPMDGRRRNLLEAGNDRGGDRLDLRPRLRAGPLNQSRGPLDVVDLLGQ